MRVLSAADAISPAVARTRQLLLGPKRWGTFFKISLVALLAGLGDGINTNFNSFNNNHGGLPHSTPQMAAVMAGIAAFALLVGLVFTAIFLVIFYVGNRMQFVLFDMVLTLRTEVRPPWRLYASRTWRWIGMKVVLFVSLVLLMLLIALPVILRIVHEFRSGQQISPMNFIGLLIGSGALLLLVMLVYFIASTLLHSFVLPAVALEDARIMAAISRLIALCRAEPGQIALYLVLQVAVAVGAGIATAIVFVIASLVAGLILGLIGLVVYFVLHNHGTAATVIMCLIFVVLGAAFVAWILAVYAAVLGALVTFRQAWALYFLGGRYTLLGDLLEPPVVYAQQIEQPTSAWPPAPAWPPPPSGI